jgi:CHASE2 domain-containing sensor protein
LRKIALMQMSNRAYYLHATAITLIIFLFIGAMKLITFRSHFFDPFNKSIKDYEVADIVFSQFRESSEAIPEERIVMVHVEEPERAQIARAVERISQHGHRVIGVDILFSGAKDSLGDALLSEQLQKTGNIVLAANLMPYDQGKQGIPGMKMSEPRFSDHGVNAYTNFLAGTDLTVRMFTPEVTTTEKNTEQAFALAIAAIYDPLAARRLLNRKKNSERINYLGDYRSFPTLYIADVLAMPESELSVFQGKIVLIGFANNQEVDAPLEDRYYTPLNPVYTGRSIPDMYGMMIHANIISMILRGKYIYEFPQWFIWPLTLCFTFFNVLVIHRIYHWLPDTFHGITRLLQLVEFLISFFFISALFYYYRIKVDFSVGFLALLLSYDMVMIYENLIKKNIKFLKNI